MKGTDIKGIIPAIVTPFKKNGGLDLDALRRLTRFLIDSGVHAIMTTGGTGEFPLLLRDEKKDVIATVANEARGQLPIIAGTAACGTKEALLLSRDAADAGANAVIVTPPYYFKLPNESLWEHYRILSDNLDIPIVVYNNPLYTGNNLDPSLIERIASLEGVIGLKQSNTDLGQFVEAVRLCGHTISICTGIDSQFYPSLCSGGKGIFSTAACVMPKMMVTLFNLTQEGRHSEALEIHMRLQDLNRLLEYDPGYVSPCKEALEMLGLPGGWVRKPMPRLTTQQRDTLKNVLKRLGAF